MPDLVIVGTGTLARMVASALRQEGRQLPAAFAVERAHRDRDQWMDAPVVDLEALLVPGWMGPRRAVVAIGSRELGEPRRRVSEALADAGFELPAFVSRAAIVSVDAVVEPGAIVLPGAIVEPGAAVRRGAVLWSGCQLCHDGDLGAWSFVGPGAVIAGCCTVGPHAFVGANATLLDHVRIAERCVVGAGAVVSRDMEQPAVVAAAPPRPVARTPEDTSAARGGSRRRGGA